MKRLNAMDILLAEQAKAVLYVEGETDFNLLRAWARVLDHPTRAWFEERPFWHSNQGRNPREAKGHFFALRAISSTIKGLLLLDGDNRGLPDREVGTDGLQIERWTRYEAESYLVHPEALTRFLATRWLPLQGERAWQFLQDQLPPAVFRNPAEPNDYWVGMPASKTLLPRLFEHVGVQLTKEEYDLVAEQMRPEEIPDEVRSKLDCIASIFGLS